MGTPNLNMNSHLRATGNVAMDQKISWRLGHQVNQKTSRGLVIRIKFYRLL